MNNKITLLGFVFCVIASTMFSSASATLQIPGLPTIPELLPIPELPLTTTTVNLSVESADMDGNTFPGQWVELWQDGVIIQEDFTPFSAEIEPDVEYQVFIYDDPDEAKFFDHWEDESTDRMRTIATVEDAALTAFFQVDFVPTENNPPEAGDDFVETEMFTSVDIEVLANDFEPDGDAIFVSDIVVFPENGDVTINDDSTITYTPFDDFAGTDTFEYEVSDGNGGTDTALVTVDVFEADVFNNPPEAGDDFAETTMNTSVDIDVLANDFEPDGDAIFVSDIVVFPENGDVTINDDSTITYMPFEGFFGTDTFEYEVSDGNGGTDTALVTVDVFE